MAAQICETCKNKGCRCYCPPNSTCGAYEPSEPRVITWFEKIRSMDIDELAEWLDENGQFDGSPWMKWWDENYCQKCDPIECHYTETKEKLGFEPFYERSIECAWCELEHKCKFFPEMKDVPDSNEIVKMWLESEIK